MARKTNTRKKRVKKNIEAGIAHIRSTFNNTIVTLTDTHGNALSGLVLVHLVSVDLVNLLHSLRKWLLKLLLKLQWSTV